MTSLLRGAARHGKRLDLYFRHAHVMKPAGWTIGSTWRASWTWKITTPPKLRSTNVVKSDTANPNSLHMIYEAIGEIDGLPWQINQWSPSMSNRLTKLGDQKDTEANSRAGQ